MKSVYRFGGMPIDVEGHELEVLNGCGASLKSTKIIQFEFGGCNIDSRTFFRDFWKFFDAHGFILFCITPFGLRRVGSYRTIEESFATANYLGVNKLFINV